MKTTPVSRFRAGQALLGIVAASGGLAAWVHWGAGLALFGVLMLSTSGIWRPAR